MDENAYENEIAALQCRIDELEEFVKEAHTLLDYGCTISPEFVSLHRKAKKLLRIQSIPKS